MTKYFTFILIFVFNSEMKPTVKKMKRLFVVVLRLMKLRRWTRAQGTKTPMAQSLALMVVAD